MQSCATILSLLLAHSTRAQLRCAASPANFILRPPGLSSFQRIFPPFVFLLSCYISSWFARLTQLSPALLSQRGSAVSPSRHVVPPCSQRARLEGQSLHPHKVPLSAVPFLCVQNGDIFCWLGYYLKLHPNPYTIWNQFNALLMKYIQI